MFFSPTINYLISRRINLHILCLSTGNADGVGNIRKAELYQACAVLKVIISMDHKKFGYQVLEDSSFTSEGPGPSRFAGWFWPSLGP
uniref:N-acetylglucosaminylphosphatidylinositol deacetylase n=1 Tax=Rhizophora mucronata TaxID=61149 RepID=A0A2P2LF11_RHIMU